LGDFFDQKLVSDEKSSHLTKYQDDYYYSDVYYGREEPYDRGYSHEDSRYRDKPRPKRGGGGFTEEYPRLNKPGAKKAGYTEPQEEYPPIPSKSAQKSDLEDYKPPSTDDRFQPKFKEVQRSSVHESHDERGWGRRGGRGRGGRRGRRRGDDDDDDTYQPSRPSAGHSLGDFFDQKLVSDEKSSHLTKYQDDYYYSDVYYGREEPYDRGYSHEDSRYRDKPRPKRGGGGFTEEYPRLNKPGAKKAGYTEPQEEYPPIPSKSAQKSDLEDYKPPSTDDRFQPKFKEVQRSSVHESHDERGWGRRGGRGRGGRRGRRRGDDDDDDTYQPSRPSAGHSLGDFFDQKLVSDEKSSHLTKYQDDYYYSDVYYGREEPYDRGYSHEDGRYGDKPRSKRGGGSTKEYPRHNKSGAKNVGYTEPREEYPPMPSKPSHQSTSQRGHKYSEDRGRTGKEVAWGEEDYPSMPSRPNVKNQPEAGQSEGGGGGGEGQGHWDWVGLAAGSSAPSSALKQTTHS
jgi:hypothetical protein